MFLFVETIMWIADGGDRNGERAEAWVQVHWCWLCWRRLQNSCCCWWQLIYAVTLLCCELGCLPAWKVSFPKGHCNISCLVALVPPDSLCICWHRRHGSTQTDRHPHSLSCSAVSRVSAHADGFPSSSGGICPQVEQKRLVLCSVDMPGCYGIYKLTATANDNDPSERNCVGV